MQQFMPVILIVGMFAIFYFGSIKPQKKQAAERKQLLDNLTIGSKIQSYGGLIGLIEAVGPETVILLLSPDDVRIELRKESIFKVIAEGDEVQEIEEEVVEEVEEVVEAEIVETKED